MTPPGGKAGKFTQPSANSLVRLYITRRRSSHNLLLYLQECAASLVIDARLDEDPVGADAGLAGVAELGGHAAGHGLIHVGRVEDDEGSVATQLQGDLLHRTSALPVEDNKLDGYPPGQDYVLGTTIMANGTTNGYKRIPWENRSYTATTILY